MRASRPVSGRLEWRKMITPPFVANVAAISLCLLRLPQQIAPEKLQALLGPLKAVGSVCMPLIMVTLGAMLARRPSDEELRSSAAARTRLDANFALGVIAVKLIILPALAIGTLLALAPNWNLNTGFRVIFLIQSATPPATALAIIARRYTSRAQSELVNRAMLWSYLAAAATLPMWLTIGQVTLNIAPPP